jgi:hypothetical protein
MSTVLTVNQILTAMREKGQGRQADELWRKKIRPHFAGWVDDGEILQLTIAEVSFLIRIDVLFKGSERQKAEAQHLIQQVYAKASESVDPDLIETLNNEFNIPTQQHDNVDADGGEGVFRSVGDYVKSLWRRGFSVDYSDNNDE